MTIWFIATVAFSEMVGLSLATNHLTEFFLLNMDLYYN